jgi:hypothetical protein
MADRRRNAKAGGGQVNDNREVGGIGVNPQGGSCTQVEPQGLNQNQQEQPSWEPTPDRNPDFHAMPGIHRHRYCRCAIAETA